MDKDKPVNPDLEVNVKIDRPDYMDDFFFIPPPVMPRCFSDTPVIDSDMGVINNYEPTPGEPLVGTTGDHMPDVLESFEPITSPETQFEGFEIMEVE